MDILGRVSRNNAILFVFTFVDETDRDFWLNKWEECANAAPEEYAKRLKASVSTLKSRINDVYATEDHKFSGVLFFDEFVEFAFTTTYLMSLYKHNCDKYKKRVKDCLEICSADLGLSDVCDTDNIKKGTRVNYYD